MRHALSLDIMKLCAGIAATAMLLVAGCHDPRYREQSDIRKARIRSHLSNYREHDAAGPQRAKQTIAVHRKLREHHKESLERTTDLARRMHERDVDRWHGERDLRRGRIRDHLHGNPDQIDDTWAKMVY